MGSNSRALARSWKSVREAVVSPVLLPVAWPRASGWIVTRRVQGVCCPGSRLGCKAALRVKLNRSALARVILGVGGYGTLPTLRSYPLRVSIDTARADLSTSLFQHVDLPLLTNVSPSVGRAVVSGACWCCRRHLTVCSAPGAAFGLPVRTASILAPGLVLVFRWRKTPAGC